MSSSSHRHKSPRASNIRNINYRLPLPGWISILHRISGLLLILSLPCLLILLLDLSLSSQSSFDELTIYWLGKPWVKLILSVLLWSYLHHFCAGIRFLLLDLHIGIQKGQATKTALLVLLSSLTLTVILCARLWGAF